MESAATGMAAARESGVVFTLRAVACVANVALSVTGFIAVEVVEGLGSAIRHRAVVAVVGVIAIVDVAVEAVRAVKPGGRLR